MLSIVLGGPLHFVWNCCKDVVAVKKNDDVSSLERICILNYLNIAIFLNILLKKYLDENYACYLFPCEIIPSPVLWYNRRKNNYKLTQKFIIP